MKKILHLNNYISYTSGVTRYIYQIVKNTKDFFEHEIISFGGEAKNLFEELQIKITELNYSSILSVPSLYKFLWNYCRQSNIDIVHNHHRLFDTITSMLPEKKFNTVTTVHSKVSNLKVISYKAAKLISVSDSMTKYLIEYFKKSENKIYTFKNFVDLTDLKIINSKSELANQLGLTGKWIIVFIGRFDKEKGPDILIKAFEKFYRVNNIVSLVMIGEGNLETQMKKLCHEKQLPVNILKPVANIYDYYNLADVVVLPSRVDPFPFVMLETGLMQKPFIGSNVDGIPELIKHKVNGVLFASENVSELVDSLKMIFEEKVFANEIANNLHKDVIEGYTAEKVIPEYVSLYNSLI